MSFDQSASRKVRRGGHIMVKFKGNRRALYANPFEFPFNTGDIAIVEADRGEDAGQVKHVLTSMVSMNDNAMEYAVIRRATYSDQERIKELRTSEIDALETCREKVANHRLPMKLIDAEHRFDGLKLIFYFTAAGRVDFRELVRDLAGTFRTRIELRQIGSRDETRRFNSFGVCGYKLCCVSFLNSFQPITTQIAKAQNLILNPSKLSGLCGKLKCCLAYEAEYYDIQEEKPCQNVREPGMRDEEIENLSD